MTTGNEGSPPPPANAISPTGTGPRADRIRSTAVDGSPVSNPNLEQAFATLAEENQDMILAEYVLDLRDEPTKSVQDGRLTVSAIQKLWPRRNLFRHLNF